METLKTGLPQPDISFLLATVVDTKTEWQVDTKHTELSFQITRMLVSIINGHFKKYTLQVYSNMPDFSDIELSLTINTNSIDTHSKERDSALQGHSFLDAEQYPFITFKSKEMKKLNTVESHLIGDLTLLGVTHPMVFNMKFSGVVKDPLGQETAGFILTGNFNRQDYGMNYNVMMGNGHPMYGNNVNLSFYFTVVKH